MDGVVDVKFAVEMRKIGGLAVLNLEGLQCRYENADKILDRISKFPPEEATRKMQEIYDEPLKKKLITKRVKQIKKESDIACASLTPKNVERYYEIALDAGLDVLVVQATVVSAEHVRVAASEIF